LFAWRINRGLSPVFTAQYLLVSRHGVERPRIVPAGVGPLAPLASNDTEAGRGKNRRVELVQR